jgi:hypothetical protein
MLVILERKYIMTVKNFTFLTLGSCITNDQLNSQLT